MKRDEGRGMETKTDRGRKRERGKERKEEGKGEGKDLTKEFPQGAV